MSATELLNFQNDLLNELATGSGLKGLVHRVSSILEKPIMITNPSHRVIECGVPEVEHLVQKYIKLTPLGTQNYYRISYLESNYRGCIFPIELNYNNLGTLIVITEFLEDELFSALADIAAKTCGLEILKQNQFLAYECEHKDVFIFDLLYGNIESTEEIISRGEIWGWKLQLPHCVIVFELDDYEQYTSDKELAFILADIVETEIAKLQQSPIVFRKKGQVTAVLTADRANFLERKAYIDVLVKKIQSITKEKLNPRIVSVGCGRACNEANEIFRSYQEAKVALELGRIMDIRSKTPFFRDLGLARILYNHDLQELIEFHKDTLGNLYRYDSEQNSDLVKTLEKFLLNRCDLKLAADALYLHPNTLRYRLKRIEEILGINLNDFDTKLDLMTALKITHIKKI